MILPRDLTFDRKEVQIITHDAKDIHIYKINDGQTLRWHTQPQQSCGA